MKTSALAIGFLVLLVSYDASAGTRQDAITALTNLHNSPLAQKLPDEIKSAEATFSLAERHFQMNEHEAAERYYLLAIQKVRILEASLPQVKPGFPAQQTEKAAERTIQPKPSEVPSKTESKTGLSEETTGPNLTVPVKNELAAPVEKSQTITTAESDSPDTFQSEKLVGSTSVYTVVKGDSLRLIAAKLGVSRQHLLKMNNLDPKASFKVGQKLKYNNRKIVPQWLKEGIVVNIPDRTLYYFRQGKLVTSLPVALGTGKKTEKYDWQTPTGKFRITSKQKDPTWFVPPSIQAEMEEEGKEVITSVPPGPDNPLGKYAIKTSLPGIMIHSTTKPASIYSFASHGCIRVFPPRMEEFFKEVKVNTVGEIIYRPVKLVVTEQGRIFLEVHQDVYKKVNNLAAEAKSLIKRHQLSERVDWKKIDAVIRQKAGVAEDISL